MGACCIRFDPESVDVPRSHLAGPADMPPALLAATDNGQATVTDEYIHTTVNSYGYHCLACELSALLASDGSGQSAFGDAVRSLPLSSRQSHIEAEVVRRAQQITGKVDLRPTAPLMECGMSSLQVRLCLRLKISARPLKDVSVGVSTYTVLRQVTQRFAPFTGNKACA